MPDLLASRRVHVVLLGVALVLLAIGLLLPRFIASERLMQSDRPLSRTDFLTAGPGNVVEVAVETNAAPAADVLAGSLLEEQSTGAFQRTSQAVRIQFAANTPIVMGTRADVRPGALLQVRGAMASDGSDLVVANRIVVLSGYVSVRKGNGLAANP